MHGKQRPPAEVSNRVPTPGRTASAGSSGRWPPGSSHLHRLLWGDGQIACIEVVEAAIEAGPDELAAAVKPDVIAGAATCGEPADRAWGGRCARSVHEELERPAPVIAGQRLDQMEREHASVESTAECLEERIGDRGSRGAQESS